LRAFFLVVLFCFLSSLQAQDVPTPPPTPTPDSGSSDSFWSRFWVSGQANFIRQQQGAFAAQYSGPHSLEPNAEHATSRVLTLYSGFQITKNLEILADVESAGGAGLSNALGLAGFTNMDVVRNPTLGTAPYMARQMLHYTVPLSSETAEATRNPLSLASTLPVRRLEFRLGKMSTVDFFDLNAVGSDSHLQFLNWTLINNGAYDYAADTRGYTYGLLMEYYDRNWVFRFGEMLMPTVANGITLDWDIARARGENWEFELHHSLFPKRTSVLRLLSFVNHANMGSYREAIDGFLSGQDSVPDITKYREQGRVKYGFGVNVEQPLTSQWRAFGRLGWNNGSTESFAYTEVDRSASIGATWPSAGWDSS
jgi:high affinity Mn2+ porin